MNQSILKLSNTFTTPLIIQVEMHRHMFFGLETSPGENAAYATGCGAQVHKPGKVAWQQRSFGGQN
jgi:hypothetical protein